MDLPNILFEEEESNKKILLTIKIISIVVVLSFGGFGLLPFYMYDFNLIFLVKNAEIAPSS